MKANLKILSLSHTEELFIYEIIGLICNLDYYTAAFDYPKGNFVDNAGNCYICYIKYDQKFTMITASNNEHLNL